MDVVPVATDDPRGVVFSSSVFPLTICGILIGVRHDGSRPGTPAASSADTTPRCMRRRGPRCSSAAQGFLGHRPDNHVATWAILALDLLSISATTAGVIRLLGPAGLGLSAALMVFVGNAFSGATSAPEMLPKGVDYVGQWSPPGRRSQSASRHHILRRQRRRRPPGRPRPVERLRAHGSHVRPLGHQGTSKKTGAPASGNCSLGLAGVRHRFVGSTSRPRPSP